MGKKQKSTKKKAKAEGTSNANKTSPRKTDAQRMEKQMQQRAKHFASAGKKVDTAEEAIIANGSKS